jgi:hypothetical protein
MTTPFGQTSYFDGSAYRHSIDNLPGSEAGASDPGLVSPGGPSTAPATDYVTEAERRSGARERGEAPGQARMP